MPRRNSNIAAVFLLTNRTKRGESIFGNDEDEGALALNIIVPGETEPIDVPILSWFRRPVAVCG
jgi:hypothetical protein